MAAASDFKSNVTCSVTEERKTITLMYAVSDPKDRIKWDWVHQRDESGVISHVVEMIALDSKRVDRSQPIPDDRYKKLGKPKKQKEDGFFKVTMSRKDEDVSIEEYFTVQ